jgi:hypothetical protein
MSERTDERERLEQALTAVRREGQKAAAIHAVVEGAVVLMTVNFGLTIVGVSLPGPTYARQAVAAALGLAVFLGAFLVRVRRPLVEQFEAANPEVREALRTARDAALDGAENAVARRLYADVLDGLQHASGARLVRTRRLVGGLVLLMLLSVATVQVSVVGLDLAGGSSADALEDDGSDSGNDYRGLESGDKILGNETDVDGGDEDLDAVIGGTGSEAGSGETVNSSAGSGGFSATGSYEAEQAGFSESDDVEDADIIREYNLEIRGGGDEQE